MIVGLKEEVPADESSLVAAADHTAAVDPVADFESTVGCNSEDTAVGTVGGIAGEEVREADPSQAVGDPEEDHNLEEEGDLEVYCTVGYCSFVYLSRGTFLKQTKGKEKEIDSDGIDIFIEFKKSAFFHAWNS